MVIVISDDTTVTAYITYAPVNINPCPPPPRPGTSGALAGDSQHFVSLLVNKVISKANESYSPLCRWSGGAGIYIDWRISQEKMDS